MALQDLYNRAKKKVSDYFAPTPNVRIRDVVRELGPSNFSRNVIQAKPFNIAANNPSTIKRIGGGIASGFLNPLINLKDFSVESANRYYGVPEKSKSQLVGMGLKSGLDIAGTFMGGSAGANLAKNAAKSVTAKSMSRIPGIITQGAKHGLKYGSGFGGLYGLAEGLSQGNKPLEIAKGTAMGAATGGLGGGVLGGGIPAASVLGKAAVGSMSGKLFRTSSKHPYFSQAVKQVGKAMPRPGLTIKETRGKNYHWFDGAEKRFIPAEKAKTVPNKYGLDLFVSNNGKNGWSVTEAKSGYALVSNKTSRQAAIDSVDYSMQIAKQRGYDVPKIIESKIRETGLSPKYLNQQEDVVSKALNARKEDLQKRGWVDPVQNTLGNKSPLIQEARKADELVNKWNNISDKVSKYAGGDSAIFNKNISKEELAFRNKTLKYLQTPAVEKMYKAGKRDPEILREYFSKSQPLQEGGSLIQEARKYKSAEEFVKAQTKQEYRSSHQLGLSDSITADKIDIPTLKEAIRTRNGYLNNYNLSDLKKLEKLQNNPDAEVTIYRASPKNELNDGDWVTIDKTYANDIKRQNGGKVFSYTVKVKDLRFPKDTETLPSLSMASTFSYSPKTSQLTDIWNKAQPLQEGVNPLIQEARKGEYLYHGTNEQVLDNISKEGLKPGMRGVQSLSKNEAYSKNWAKGGITPQGKTEGVMLRVNRDLIKDKILPSNSKVSSDKLNEVLTKETIPPEYLDIYKNGKWQPLKSQPLQEGVKKITKGELPKIETTPSKVAKSIETPEDPLIQEARKVNKDIRTLTIKTADGKNEYVAQIGDNVKDRVGRNTGGFKSQKTSPNFKTQGEADKWIKENIKGLGEKTVSKSQHLQEGVSNPNLPIGNQKKVRIVRNQGLPMAGQKSTQLIQESQRILPTQNGAENPTSKFSQRISIKNPKVPKVEYTPSVTDDVLSKAKANLAMGNDFAIKQARNANLGAESNATAMALLDDAIEKNNWDTVDVLTKEFSPRFSKQGQEIQILSRWGRLKPAGAINYTQHLIDKAKQVSKVNIEFTEQAKKEIAELAKAVQKTPEGTRERALSSALLMKKISEQIPSSIGRKISTIQTMAQLLNPKTAIRNVVGNFGFAGGEAISDVVGTPIDIATSLVTGKRTKTLPSLNTLGKGFTRGTKEGFEEAILGVDVKNLPSQFDLQNAPTFKGKVGQLGEKALSVELKSMDRAFYQSAYDESLRQQMVLNKITKATPEMQEIAHNDALYKTFQDESNAAKLFMSIKKGLNLGKDFGLGDLVLKYPKTPGNLLARAIDYSPAGYAKALIELVQPAFKKPFNQKAFVEAISRGTVGSAGLVGLGAILGKLGVVSGKSAEDKDIRNLEKTQGKGQYKLNVSALKRYALSGFNKEAAKEKEGDKLMTYDWFQPFAVPISIGANAVQKKKQSTSSVVAESITSGAETLAEQPLVQGLKKLFGYGDVLGGIEETAKGAPASFIPTFLSQIRQFTDNQKKQLIGGGFYNEAKALVKNKIPGVAGTLPDSYTVLGEKEKIYQNDSNSLFNVFLNPSFISTLENKPATKEVLDIFERSGETQQAPRTVQKSLTINNTKKELTAEEISKYQEYVGTRTNTAFDKLVKTKEFQGMPDEEKAKYMAGILTDINTAAKIELFGLKTEPWRVKKAEPYMSGQGIDYSSDISKKISQTSTSTSTSTSKTAKTKKSGGRKVAKIKPLFSLSEIDNLKEMGKSKKIKLLPSSKLSPMKKIAMPNIKRRSKATQKFKFKNTITT